MRLIAHAYFSGKCTHCVPVWNLKAIASVNGTHEPTIR